LDDRESETRAAELPGPRLVDAEETLREARDVARRDTDPGVLDGDLDHPGMLAVGRPGTDHHPTTRWSVLEGIVDQVDEHLPDAIPIGGDGRRLGRDHLREPESGTGGGIA